jgi:hypothetical protein
MNEFKVTDSVKKVWTEPSIKIIPLNAARSGASQPGFNDGQNNKS